MEDNARSVWAGGLPTIFKLAATSVTSLVPPRALIMCLPRQSLLPFVCDDLCKHFAPFTPAVGSTLWFEHEGVPLRWQVPIGVLFDLLVGATTAGPACWEITVHFQSFPPELLQAARSEAELVLVNALKESCYLLCNSAMPVMALSKGEQENIFAAMCHKGNAHLGFCTYRTAQVQIEQAIAGVLHAAGCLRPRWVPLRIYFSPTDWRQLPMPPSLQDGSPATMREALALNLPEELMTLILKDSSLSREVASRDDGGMDHAGPPKILVQGVNVPLETSISWLWATCRHPDGWLYVSVVA